MLVSSRGAGDGRVSGEVQYSGDSLASVQIESVSKSVGLHSLQLTPQVGYHTYRLTVVYSTDE